MATRWRVAVPLRTPGGPWKQSQLARDSGEFARHSLADVVAHEYHLCCPISVTFSIWNPLQLIREADGTYIPEIFEESRSMYL